MNPLPNESPPNGSGFYCDIRKVDVFSVTVFQPDIAIFAIGGALIGFTTFLTILRHRKYLLNSEVYTVLFFLFGCMNTSGLFINSLDPKGNPATKNQTIIELIDLFCSSAVSLTFIYCGLTDVGVFKDKSALLRAILGVSYGLLFYAWVLSELGKIQNMFNYLYTDLTVIGSLSFFVLSFIWLLKNKTIRGIEWLLLAGVSGVVGILVLKGYLGDFCSWKVDLFGVSYHLPHSGGVWYFFSDLSLVMFALFYLFSKSIPSPKIQEQDNTSDEIKALLQTF
eukprot:TRINITY_DN4530_c0_g1_i1.p1 TRINITY_DN4530_c0_g1~~TRINITY_DN4530_c0_g1_i1.p1  ORF type:complete len:292 (+),score=64.30 TRINITY_DN4530_c0_g1_i1:37-876(+)